jgi:signal transduction histidine kinase
MKVNSISRKLLTRVLSVYFILTFVVTCGQILAEYFNTKSNINNEILTLEKTFRQSLTRAIWELNNEQADVIATGLVSIPMIKGIVIHDENNRKLAQFGETIELDPRIFAQFNDKNHIDIEEGPGGLFGKSFPLEFKFSGRSTIVGNVTIFSNRQVIISRIEVGLYFLVGNAILKTAFLMLLFTLAFEKLLTRPLKEMTEQIKHFDIDDPSGSKLYSMDDNRNELSVLQDAYNNLIDQMVNDRKELAKTQGQLLMANTKLDDHNVMLELEVARKTSSLSNTMLELEAQQKDLKQQQQKLTEENERRRKTEKALISSNQELKHSLEELNQAKECLLSSERMAALGHLAAGVSHEVNTPIGIGVTATSYLSELFHEFEDKFVQQKMSKKQMEDFIQSSGQSISLLTNNLQRASEMLSSFKQVAVDQSSEQIREINFRRYLEEILQSLYPEIKKKNIKIMLSCADNINFKCNAGALSQIFTNLIINSIVHGFENMATGEITINIETTANEIHIDYQDNGCGVSEDKLETIFEAFYTTKQGSGGTGLGAHIVHNLITETFGGTIEASGKRHTGLRYQICLPIKH